MKKFLKLFKKVFMFLLIIPMLFIGVSCGKDKDNGSTGGENPGIVTPGGGGSGGGGSGGSEDSGGENDPDDGDDDPEVVADKFNVKLNYDLPAFISELLIDETKTATVEDGYTLPTFVGTAYENFFDGWYTAEAGSGEKITDLKLSGEKDEEISIYAKWKEIDIERYFYSDGLIFSFDETAGSAKPISYTGDDTIVVIPQGVKKLERTYYVESIGENCFKNSSIKELRTKVDYFAVGDSAFEDSDLEEIDFSRITKVGNSAFKNTKVKNAVFTGALTQIGTSAFYGCSELESADFSRVNSGLILNVPSNLFYECSSLTSCDLSENMTIVNQSAFYGCSSLESFDFIKNSSIVEIKDSAFAYCEKLDNIEIPERIVSYGTNIFGGCKIKNMTVSTLCYEDMYSSENNFSLFYGNLKETLETLTLKGDISTIYDNYFKGYSNLKTFVMCNSVTKVSKKAFDDCIKLENITFSTAIVGDNINMSAFVDTKWYNDLDENLTAQTKDYLSINNTLVYVKSSISGEFSIAEGVEYIVEGVFANCQNLTSVSIPASVSYINNFAFMNTKLTSITVDDQNEKYALDNAVVKKYNSDFSVGTPISYSALYSIVDGKKDTLIAYVSGESGGFYILPSTVRVVYDEAFSSINKPEYVYIESDAASEVVFSSRTSNYTKYIFANSKVTKRGTNIRTTIYEDLTHDHYEINPESEMLIDLKNTVDSLSHKYYIIIFEYDTGFGVQKFYYLLDLNKPADENMTDISAILLS